MSFQQNKRPDFERPPVAEWMSPPKSCDLPFWKTPTITQRKVTEPATGNTKEPRATKHDAQLDIEENSLEWISPPKSRRRFASEEEHKDELFSLKLSPQVSVSVHSPKGVTAYVSSIRDKKRKKKKVSLTIRSPRSLKSKNKNSSNDGSVEESSEVEDKERDITKNDVSDQIFSGRKDCLKENSGDRLAASSAILVESKPRGVLRKVAVMKDFIPPSLVGKDSKEPLSARKCIKKVQIPEFKPPYTCSPPAKLSPEKKISNSTCGKMTSSQQKTHKILKITKHSIDAVDQVVATLADSPPKVTEKLSDSVSVLNERKSKDGTLILDKGVLQFGSSPKLSTPRKRLIDVKAAQDYIRDQKEKRRKTSQVEKSRQKIVMEERKKKLEELRIKSLQLATASKKKQVPSCGIKTVEKDDDHTLSLGLRQVKPKRSFADSLASLGKSDKLKKVDGVTKLEPSGLKKEKGVQHNFVENKENEAGLFVPLNIHSIHKNDQYSSEIRLLSERLTVPEVKSIAPDINITLLKLAQAIQNKIEEKEKNSARLEKIREVVEEVKTSPKKTEVPTSSLSKRARKMIKVDAETMECLKEEIKGIAEGFQVLRAAMSRSGKVVETCEGDKRQENIPIWLQTIRPHPYNVITAIRNKLRLDERIELTGDLQKGVNKEQKSESPYLSDFEPLTSSVLEPATPSLNHQISSNLPKKQDSGSDISTSILDSDKFISAESDVPEDNTQLQSQYERFLTKSISEASIPESIQASHPISSTASSFKENIVLVSPGKTKNNIIPKLNNVERLNFAPKSESSITQIIDNLSGGSDKGEKSGKELKETNKHGAIPRQDPFQALLDSEFNVLNNLQQNLALFVETRRMITGSKSEKAVNTDVTTLVDDHAVQTSLVDELRSQAEIIETDINEVEDTIRTEMADSERKDSAGTEVEESSILSETLKEIRREEKLESETITEMLTRMMEDEDMRCEHQLALIQLRQDALVEKTNACLAMLEAKKRMLRQKKEINSDSLISAINKRQRGILLKYRNERQEMERLRRMHKITSDERKMLIRQEREIHNMQRTTKGFLAKYQKSTKFSGVNEELSFNAVKSLNTLVQEKSDTNVEQPNLFDSEALKQCKKYLGEKEDKLKREKHFMEEILQWEKRLEVEESRLIEMKTKALSVRDIKQGSAQVEDRSTSPFVVNDVPESSKISIETQFNGNSESIPEVLSADSVPEEISALIQDEETSKLTVTRSGYTSDSFESSSEVQKTSPRAEGCKAAGPPSVKSALSPRHGSRRRHSSGSDDSPSLSHNETTSEPSDVECRLKALKEQLKRRKQEADRLRREQKRKQRERLKQKEESLVKQIQAYDVYIEKLKHDVEQENKQVSPIIRPVIKQPKAAGKKKIFDEEKKTVEAESHTESVGEEVQHAKITFSQSIGEIIDAIEGTEGSDITKNVSITESQFSDSVDEELDQPEIMHVPEEISREEFMVREEISTSIREESVVNQADESKNDKDDCESISAKSENNFSSSACKSSEQQEREFKVNSSEMIKTEIESHFTEQHHKSSERSLSATKASEETDEVEESITEQLGNSEENFEQSEEVSKELNNENLFFSEEDKTIVPEKLPVVLGKHDIDRESVDTTTDSLERSTSCLNDAQLEQDVKKFHSASGDEICAASKSGDIPEYAEKDSYSATFESISEASLSSRSCEEEIEEKLLSFENKREKKFISNSHIIQGAQLNEKADQVVENLLEELLRESLGEAVVIVQKKQKKEKVKQLTEKLCQQVLQDALDIILEVYNSKKLSNKTSTSVVLEDPISPERMTVDIRRRIHEIMAQQMPTSCHTAQATRVQTMLQTTYDVSPNCTPPDHDERADKQNFISSLALSSCAFRQVQVAVHKDLTEADTQEWFDDDFGLSKTRKEAEALRLQQLQIEQEIEQLQAQQEQVPYFYLREIPNKPPPPYTPPGAAPCERSPPAPTSEEEITRHIRCFARSAYRSLHGQLANHAETTDHFTKSLWDLAHELVKQTCRVPEIDKESVPWEHVPPPLSAWRVALRPTSEDSVVESVVHQALVLFNLRPRVAQESLLSKWSRKKRDIDERDYVDELLVWESQAEEAEWTRFDQEIVQVKNEVTCNILDSLVDETTTVMDAIIKKKASMLGS